MSEIDEKMKSACEKAGLSPFIAMTADEAYQRRPLSRLVYFVESLCYLVEGSQADLMEEISNAVQDLELVKSFEGLVKERLEKGEADYEGWLWTFGEASMNQYIDHVALRFMGNVSKSKDADNL